MTLWGHFEAPYFKMLNDASVASAGSYIRTCRRIRNSKKIATIRDFHQNICVNPTNYYWFWVNWVKEYLWGGEEVFVCLFVCFCFVLFFSVFVFVFCFVFLICNDHVYTINGMPCWFRYRLQCNIRTAYRFYSPFKYSFIFHQKLINKGIRPIHAYGKMLVSKHRHERRVKFYVYQ